MMVKEEKTPIACKTLVYAELLRSLDHTTVPLAAKMPVTITSAVFLTKASPNLLPFSQVAETALLLNPGAAPAAT